MICSNITKILKEIFEIPASEFDADRVRDELNELIKRRARLKPQEAIGMAEAFIEAPWMTKEAASMLIGNLLFQLYNIIYPNWF